MDISRAIFRRAELLMGTEAVDRLAQKRVIIFGVGGVGSWVAEGLIRSGIMNLTIVDSDCVCVTNVNRQLMATTKTIGQVKVDALKEHLLEISPAANITALRAIYSAETADSFALDQYDAIVDAIDSLNNKALLILNACKTNAYFVSSMGAALKMDPTKIRVAEFWKVQGCPLGHALRKKLKREKTLPEKKFMCVYSEEVLPNMGENAPCGTDQCICAKRQAENEMANDNWSARKAQTNGSMVHITGIFGFTIAGLLLQELKN